MKRKFDGINLEFLSKEIENLREEINEISYDYSKGFCEYTKKEIRKMKKTLHILSNFESEIINERNSDYKSIIKAKT